MEKKTTLSKLKIAIPIWVVWKIIFLLPALFFFNKSKAQEPFYQKLTINNGLPSNCVYEIKQDRDGYMWFATDKGVARFDGGQFEIYNDENGLVDNDVFLVRPDSKGRVWILSSNGEACFWKNGKIFNKYNTTFLKHLVSDTWFNSWGEDKNENIWFGTYNNNFFKLDKKNQIHNFLGSDQKKSDRIFGLSNQSDITIDSIGNAWTVGIFGATNLTANPYKIVFPLTPVFGKPVRSLLLDNHKILSMIGDEAMVSSPSENIKIKDFQIKNGCIFLVQGLNGDIWFSNLKNLNRFKDGNLSKKSLETVFHNIAISNIFFDAEKNIWLGTLGEGAWIIQHPNIKHYKSIFPFKKEIQCVFKDSSGVWVGGDGGNLAFITDGTIKLFPKIKKLNYQGRGRIKNIKKLGGDHVALIYESQLIIMNSFGKMATLPLGTKSFYNFNNEYLIGTSTSLFRLPKSNFNKISSMIPNHGEKNPFLKINLAISNYRIHSGHRFNEIEMDSSDMIWLGTNKGLYTLNPKTDSVKSAFDQHPNLRKPIQSILALNKQTVIIAPANGGIFLNIQNKLYSLEKNHIVSKSAVKKIVKISQSAFWLCTNRGLFLFEMSGFKCNIQHFGSRDGILSDEINDIAKGEGNWLIASDKGLTIFPDDKINTNPEIAPSIFAGLFQINNRSLPNENSYTENKTEVRFRYSCLSFKNLGRYQFRYRLFKTDNWKMSEKLEQKISNLARGSYRIEVQAKSIDSPWSNSVIYPEFEVLPVFWQRGWFLIISFIASISIIAIIFIGIYKNRLQKENLDLQLIDANLKALRAQIKPHFIFNAMNSVQNFFLKNETEKGLEFLGSFSLLMRKMLSGSNKNFHSVQDEVNLIKDYLDIEKGRIGQEFDFSILVDKNINVHTTLIPTMILQPLIENALWHGIMNRTMGSGEIELKVQKKQILNPINPFKKLKETTDRLVITITDNGVGRKFRSTKNNEKSDSFGIKSITEKLELLNRRYKNISTIQIIDLEDNQHKSLGTKVILDFPMDFQ